MKLDRVMSGAFLALAVALACGCSAPPRTAARCPASTTSSAAGTASLMSAEMAGPAPRVGKPQLGVETEEGAIAPAEASDLKAPKDIPRREEGSRRGGDFGTSK